MSACRAARAAAAASPLRFVSYAFCMHGTDWINVIRRIPAALHDTVSFATVSGSEIMAQDILRLEGDFVVLRGRMAGSQDAGRVIVLPYAQIVNLAINKQLKDNEVQAIFGKDVTPTFAPAAAAPDLCETPHGIAEVPSREEATPVGAKSSDAKMPAAQPGKAAPVSKSLLLARLRQRLADKS